MLEVLGDAGNAGDWAWMRLGIADRRVVQATGEGPGVTALARAVTGLTVLAAAAVAADPLAGEALAAALGTVVDEPPVPRRIAVAMSGGVDSAVALMKAREAGLEPVGVTLRLWIDPSAPDGERACCSTTSVRAARELCHSLGLPHITLDRRERFRRDVVGTFVDGYAAGETPNPCVTCNGGFRFDELFRFCDRIGASRLATGHYARVADHRGRQLLARADDPDKDQSYMLGLLDPAVLPRLWFPLGEQTKTETRMQAHAAGLAAATARESQEICFLGGGDHRGFLERQGLPSSPGPILDPEGRQIGSHDGFWRFTPGQRRGLAVAAGRGPSYVLSTNARTNAVVAGPRPALATSSVSVRGQLHVPVDRVSAKLRYRSPAVAANVERHGGRLALSLREPAYGVACGQAAVLYDGDAIVGSGLVQSIA
jgi:tRNA-uridine 2-sulfurtransferase